MLCHFESKAKVKSPKRPYILLEAINSTLLIITCCRISLYPEFKSPSVNDAIFNSIVLYIYNKTRKKEQSFNHNVRWQYVVQTENISFETQT